MSCTTMRRYSGLMSSSRRTSVEIIGSSVLAVRSCQVPPRGRESRSAVRGASRPASCAALLQELAGDEELLDLAGALVDPQRAHLAIEALHRGSPHHPLAAMEL